MIFEVVERGAPVDDVRPAPCKRDPLPITAEAVPMLAHRLPVCRTALNRTMSTFCIVAVSPTPASTATNPVNEHLRYPYRPPQAGHEVFEIKNQEQMKQYFDISQRFMLRSGFIRTLCDIHSSCHASGATHAHPASLCGSAQAHGLMAHKLGRYPVLQLALKYT